MVKSLFVAAGILSMALLFGGCASQNAAETTEPAKVEAEKQKLMQSGPPEIPVDTASNAATP